MNAKRRRAHDKLAALPGVRPVLRPVVPGGRREFDLYYVRTGRKSMNPLVIIPGGPGAASVALYRGLRRHAAAKGLDVIMMDHRGVGMSRHDDRGNDLPPEALTIEQAVNDIAAVLDDAQVEKAMIYGTSYGTYLAAGVGVRHPNRVHSMVLDSPVLSARDIDAARNATRRVLWDGDDPDAAELAPKVRRLVDDGVLTPEAGQLTAAMYGFAGPDVLTRQLDLLLHGKQGLWTLLDHTSRFLFERKAPYRHEPDLVGRIGFRELNYGADPDGKPLDPAKYDASRWIAEPFNLYDCCMENDGAAALILMPADRAEDLPRKPVYLLGAAVGSGYRTGAIPHNSPLYASASFDTVAPNLYRMAGLGPTDI